MQHTWCPVNDIWHSKGADLIPDNIIELLLELCRWLGALGKGDIGVDALPLDLMVHPARQQPSQHATMSRLLASVSRQAAAVRHQELFHSAVNSGSPHWQPRANSLDLAFQPLPQEPPMQIVVWHCCDLGNH